MWNSTDNRTKGDIPIPVDTQLDYYAIVWPDNGMMRSYPLCNNLSSAEDKFKEILREGLMVRGESNGMLEWINIPNCDYAYIAFYKVEEDKEDKEDE